MNPSLINTTRLFTEAHNLSGIAVRVPETAWWQKLALELMDTQAGADALDRRRKIYQVYLRGQKLA